jgi:hypothetical protein
MHLPEVNAASRIYVQNERKLPDFGDYLWITHWKEAKKSKSEYNALPSKAHGLPFRGRMRPCPGALGGKCLALIAEGLPT